MRIRHLFQPLAALTDGELMLRVSGHDDDRAFGELYRRHARRLTGFLYRQTNGNEALAADLAQDAFMKVWAARGKFSGSSFRTWLFTIALNLLKNHYRHSEHRKEYELQSRQTQEEADDKDLAHQLDRQAFDDALSRLLEKMPPESRLLFSLRFEEELTVPQIALILAVPEGTVKSRLHTITQILKHKLHHHDTV